MNQIILHSETRWSYEADAEFQPPKKEAFEWFKSPTQSGEVHIFEDLFLTKHTDFNCKAKIASILECPEIYKYYCSTNSTIFNPYEWIKHNHQHFDYIMSPFHLLRELVGDKFLWVPALSSRVKYGEFGMYEKARNMSLIASFKDWTYGHKLRHVVISELGKHFDVYGSGYNNTINEHGKLIAIAPYRFSVCILNAIEDDYFTEALTDLLAVGTIPVVYGTKNIAKYWNPEGLVIFQSLEELREIIPKLTQEYYESRIDAVLENIEITKEYVTIPDFIYKNYKTLLESL